MFVVCAPTQLLMAVMIQAIGCRNTLGLTRKVYNNLYMTFFLRVVKGGYFIDVRNPLWDGAKIGRGRLCVKNEIGVETG